MKNKYSYTIQWSDEDKAYICRCKEYPSLGTHGNTSTEALFEMNAVLCDIEEEENGV